VLIPTAAPLRTTTDEQHVTAAAAKGIVKLLTLFGGCEDWSVAIAARYKGYRYPIECIGHAVWLYHRFALSLRDVEELLVARGVVVTYKTIRRGALGADAASWRSPARTSHTRTGFPLVAWRCRY
jgi:hypothetical protein